MAQLIDTSVIISLERRKLPLGELVRLVTSTPIAIASISASELLAGVHRADTEARRSQRRKFVELVLDSIEVLPFDLEVARVHARIATELRAHPIGAHDLIIAATALAFDYGVLTANTREFHRVPGLTIQEPAC